MSAYPEIEIVKIRNIIGCTSSGGSIPPQALVLLLLDKSRHAALPKMKIKELPPNK
jgi:hypothetical protein